jgi:hypothetical protein
LNKKIKITTTLSYLVVVVSFKLTKQLVLKAVKNPLLAMVCDTKGGQRGYF